MAHGQEIKSRRTFAERLLKRVKGKDRAALEPLEAGVTKEEFETFMNEWLAGDLHRRRTRQSHIAGKTPQERVDEWFAIPGNRVSRIPPEDLDYLLMPGEEKTCAKKGFLVNKHYYAAPSIEVRTRCEIRHTADVGRLLVYRDGKFLTIAECPELLGISKKDVAVEAAIQHASRTKAHREANRILTKPISQKAITDSIRHHRLKGSTNVERIQHADLVQTEGVIEAMKARVADLEAQAQAKAPLPIRRQTKVDVLRDIHDTVGIPVLLVGMSGIEGRLVHLKQLARRISVKIDFHPLDLEDTRLVVDTMSEVKVLDDLVNYMHAKSQGCIGLLVVALAQVECFAKVNQMQEIGLKAWGKKELFLGSDRVEA